MTEVAKATEPPAGHLVQIAGASIAAVVWVLTRATFYEGYFDALGVPSKIGLAPPLGVGSLMISGIFGWMTVEGFWTVARIEDWFGRGPIRSLLSRTMTGLMVAAAVSGFFEWLGWLNAGVRIAGGVFVAWTALLWLRPVFVGAKGMTFRERVVALAAKDAAERLHRRAVGEEKEPPTEVDHLWNRFFAWGGRGARLALVALLLAPLVGYFAGRNSALTRSQWIVVEHSALPPSPPETRWVLLSSSEGRLWVAGALKNELGSEVVAVAAEGGRLREVKLGKLRPAGATR